MNKTPLQFRARVACNARIPSQSPCVRLSGKGTHLAKNEPTCLGPKGVCAMDTMLSFIIVVLFSGWIFRLKTEISTLEKLVAVGDGAATPFNPIHAESAPLQTSVVFDRAVKPPPVPRATPAAAAPTPNIGKPSKKGGIQVWTLDE
jgi:hypothetical protein